MPLRQGRASRIIDRGDGTLERHGGAPKREARIMELAGSHGFPVPRVHEVRPDALVLERIEGPTMARHLVRHPWLASRHMRTLVELHERLHAIRFDDACLVHFDLHPENVLLGPDGPVLIDWTNAHGGDANADVAMTWLILATSAGLPGRILARLFASAAGSDPIGQGLPGARAFRLADPHVTDPEKGRVRLARP